MAYMKKSLKDEASRNYKWDDGNSNVGDVTITSPRTLRFKVREGGIFPIQHYITDSSGKTYVLPAPGMLGCQVTFYSSKFV